MESLQALVLRRAREIGGREGPLSTRQLESAAGGKVSRTVFQQIMAGEYDAKIGQRTINGLSDALQVPIPQVEQAAGAPPSFGPFQLPDEAARLTPAQRRAVKQVVDAMLDPGGAVSLPAERRLEAVPSKRAARVVKKRPPSVASRQDAAADASQDPGHSEPS